MDLWDVLRSRRTIRKYSEKPVEFDKIVAICEAGALAPSAGNLQNWKFILLTEKEKIRESLCNACLDQECFNTAQIAIVVCADEAIMERQYGLRGKRLYSVQNCAAAIQNMLLAAHTLGLGAAWIGAFNEEKLRDMLDIPDVARPQAVITLGYPAERPGDKRMRLLDDVIRFDMYEQRHKDLHRILTDLSVEWERQGKNLKEKLHRPAGSFVEMCKDLLDKGRDKRKDMVTDKEEFDDEKTGK